jgi:hypothetical protein
MIGRQVIGLVEVNHVNLLSIHQCTGKLFEQEVTQAFILSTCQDVKIRTMQDCSLEGLAVGIDKVQVETGLFDAATLVIAL